jgi:hypothetical protein
MINNDCGCVKDDACGPFALYCYESEVRGNCLPPPPPPAPPAVDCGGGWGAWGDCSAACGGGTRSRTYTVTRAAANGGAGCAIGSGAEEAEACGTEPCAAVDCEVSWGAWGACDAPCGGGGQSRSFTVTTQPAFGGAACPTAHVENQGCNPGACVVPGSPGDCSAADMAIIGDAGYPGNPFYHGLTACHKI